ncbi:hypothetical protein BY996DRAFT_6625170 [Phakopsora pachyrhizi]|uniref:Uncharacterized protein n=1 Tax=Phakopsora pachyrhizi TaxID=170000 RepID=A0AAV0B9A6_PHAPC|nr:hypothetical protein BY996DRAFT_6625170 [Phakopsora pachyrhizi]CAH7683783.1 hypothetical protein PPACK8108_LOCUS17503 [Phakopsora pachyrhizi]
MVFIIEASWLGWVLGRQGIGLAGRAGWGLAWLDWAGYLAGRAGRAGKVLSESKEEGKAGWDWESKTLAAKVEARKTSSVVTPNNLANLNGKTPGGA